MIIYQVPNVIGDDRGSVCLGGALVVDWPASIAAAGWYLPSSQTETLHTVRPEEGRQVGATIIIVFFFFF